MCKYNTFISRILWPCVSMTLSLKQQGRPSVLEFLNNLRGLGTEYRNRVVVPARQATQPGGIDSLESTLGLHKEFKIRALELNSALHA